jgi:16S rRNA (guanine527-N7)-methyltransferase
MLEPRIAALLRPFLDAEPDPVLLAQLRVYLQLLLKWNARTNLTAIRDPEAIVTRHFGESLFAASVLQEAGALAASPTLSDIGSGAGFPGIPIKLFAPDVRLTLIESQNKKATFLREVIRSLQLRDAEVFCDRAETLGSQADVVTLRAVEKFESILPVAASLVSAGGTLTLLIGDSQVEIATRLLGSAWTAMAKREVPESTGRVIWLAQRDSITE